MARAVIEMLRDVLRDLLANGNTAGVVTNLRVNLIIGLGGVHRLFQGRTQSAKSGFLR